MTEFMQVSVIRSKLTCNKERALVKLSTLTSCAEAAVVESPFWSIHHGVRSILESEPILRSLHCRPRQSWHPTICLRDSLWPPIGCPASSHFTLWLVTNEIKDGLLPLWTPVHFVSWCWHPWTQTLDPCPGCHGHSGTESGSLNMLSSHKLPVSGYSQRGESLPASCLGSQIVNYLCHKCWWSISGN